LHWLDGHVALTGGEDSMSHGLNLTLPLKQDPESLARLQALKAAFETRVQPVIEAALKKSQLVHFARVLVIGDKYIQVITEYEGDHQAYTEFFRRELTPIFDQIFAIADVEADVTDTNSFWKAAKQCNVHSLGRATDGAKDFDGNPAGWLFSAYDHRTVRDVQEAIQKAGG
jgi:hypothetical protein